MTIRFVKDSDTADLLAIYRPYVENTAITFEYTVPTEEEFRERIRKISAFYPYLVAEEDGLILGYAYSHAFQAREAYAWSVETTIYLHEKARGKGLGHKLYDQLETYLQEMGITNVNACIALASQESPYLTDASRRFHEKRGYSLVGNFHKSGYKFQEWFDMVWMEKWIGRHDKNMAPVVSIGEVLMRKR